MADDERHVQGERRAATVLLAGGLTLSVIGLVLGIVLAFTDGSAVSGTVPLREVPRSGHGGRLFLLWGIAVLAALPALRVLGLVFAFAWDRDWRSAVVAFSVAGILALAAVAGYP